MGFIRGSLLVILGVLLFISLTLGNVLYSMSLSLEYENVKPELVSVSKNFLVENIGLKNAFEEQNSAMNLYCKKYNEFVFNYGEYTFNIPCSTINLGPEAIINEGISQFVEKNYYQKYNCELFVECAKQYKSPLFIFSEKVKNYCKEKFKLSLLISIILIIIMFIFTENRLGMPIKIGSLLVIVSLPFFKLNSILSKFDMQSIQLIQILFTKSEDVFWIGFILGLSLIAIGVIIKLFKIGFKLNELFRKKEEVSKEEIKDEIKKELKKEEKTPEKLEKKKKKSKEKLVKPVQELIEKIGSKKK